MPLLKAKSTALIIVHLSKCLRFDGLQFYTFLYIINLPIKENNDLFYGFTKTYILYFLFDKNKFVLLHGFVKKANKPPERELDRALTYKNDYERRCQDE